MSRPPSTKPLLALVPATGESLDPNDPQALVSLWTVLSKCADAIHNGRRLENMSWRIWNREVLFRCPNDDSSLMAAASAPSLTEASSSQSLSSQLSAPKLSCSSVESLEPDQEKELPTASCHYPHILSPTPSGDVPPRRNYHPKRLSSRQVNQLFELFKTDDLNAHKGFTELDDTTGSFDTPKAGTRSSSPRVGEERTMNALKELKGLKGLRKTDLEDNSENRPGSSQKRESMNAETDSRTDLQAATQTTQPIRASISPVSPVSAISQPKNPAPSLFLRRPSHAKETVKKTTSDYSLSEEEDETDEDSDSDSGRLGYNQRAGTSTSIVRGFSPTNISVSYHNRSPQLAAAKKSSESSSSRKLFPKKQYVSSQSSSSQPPDSSWKLTKARASKMPREKMFFIESSPSDNEGGESLSSTDGSRGKVQKGGHQQQHQSSSQNSLENPSAGLTEAKLLHHNSKQASLFAPRQSTSNLASKLRLQHQLEANTEDNEEAVVDEEDDDDNDDDDDDDSAWDSVDDESDSTFDERSFFVREEEPKRPLTRPSLLSSLFLNNPQMLRHQLDQQLRRQRQRDHENDDHEQELHVEDDGRRPDVAVRPLNPMSGLLHAQVQAHIPPPAAMSPRTTRRNMLATELSESVRKNLLWERQQGTLLSVNPVSNNLSAAHSSTVSPTTSSKAVLKKSHTSTGVPQLKHLANLSHSLGAENNTSNIVSPVETWKEDLDDNNMDFNYHARGW